jgi:DNA polymerase-3 subunit alpha
MTEFAAYCFNRSHSAAYALVAYQTAYLKTHYPVEYVSALLSSVRSDLDKIQHYILMARRLEIKVLPPDVTQSGLDFTPDYSLEGKAIRFGLASVKGVGVGVVESIITARDDSPFTSMEDFLQRVDVKVLNRKTLEALIHSGAFERFGYPRKQLFYNIDTLINFAQQAHERKLTGQVSLFSMMGALAPEEPAMGGLMLTGPAEEYTDNEIQKVEKELLGFYVSSHPLDSVIDTLPLMVSHTVASLKEVADGTEVLLGGMISSVMRKMTKTGKPIVIGSIEDLTGTVEFVAFSDTIEKINEFLHEGLKVTLRGKLQFRGDESYSVVVNTIKLLADSSPLELQFRKIPRFEDIAFLRHVLANNKGENPVILSFQDGTKIQVGSQFWVNGNREQVTGTIRQHFGELVAVS